MRLKKIANFLISTPINIEIKMKKKMCQLILLIGIFFEKRNLITLIFKI